MPGPPNQFGNHHLSKPGQIFHPKNDESVQSEDLSELNSDILIN